MVSLELYALGLGAAVLASACGEVKREPTECELRARGGGGVFARGSWGRDSAGVCRLQSRPPGWHERDGVQFSCETSSPAATRFDVTYWAPTRPGWVPALPWGERVELSHRGGTTAEHRPAVAIRDLDGKLLFGGQAMPQLPTGQDPRSLLSPERDFFFPLEFDTEETGCPMVHLGCRSRPEPSAEWARVLAMHVSLPGGLEPSIDLLSGAEDWIGPYLLMNLYSKEYLQACLTPGVGATGYGFIIAREDL